MMIKLRFIVFSISVVLISLLLEISPALGNPPAGGSVPRFSKSQIYIQQGEDVNEVEVILLFDQDKILISGGFQAEIPYADIAKVIYERSTHPRVKTAIFISPWALLSKSKKHWLYLFLKDENSYMLRLDKTEYQLVLMTLKSKSGLEIEYHKEE